MGYSLVTLRAELISLGAQKNSNPFLWEKNKEERLPKQLVRRFPVGRVRANYINELTEYCWLVYSKARHAIGPQYIGRTGDLWVPQRLEEVGINQARGDTLWDAWTQGNIQVMDKWSPIVNDCWVLGGIHRRANFELYSKEAPENLWDHLKGYHIVTARELLGLRLFGYKRVQKKDKVIYSCENSGKAIGATLNQYDRDMAYWQRQKAHSITRLIHEMAAGLNREIQSFDRTRLRSIPATV